MESRLARLLLRAIDGYESRHGQWPTVTELAADLGIPPEFGHRHLVDRLQLQLTLGRVSLYRDRFGLTTAGRRLLESDAIRRTRKRKPETSASPR